LFWKYRFMYLEGAVTTLELAFFAVICGTILGLVFALLRMCKIKPLSWLSTAYIEIIRGTPSMVQMMIIYFGINSTGIRIPAFVAGVAMLSINSSAYMAEIFRSGIQAVDHGQTEAAMALGMTQRQNMRFIVLPQAFRNILPAVVNEFITIIKESAIVSLAAVGEIMYQADRVRGATFSGVEPYLYAAMIYFVITFTLSKVLGKLERRLHKSDRTA
jgi:His/Glu/Gln/Arg/opine family amino acid ABC transporter permease subunit